MKKRNLKAISTGTISSIFLVALSIVIFLTPSVSATSVYDNVLDIASSARVSTSWPPYNCSPKDISASWASYILDDDAWADAVYDTGTDRESVQTALQDVLDTQMGLAVMEREIIAAGIQVGNYSWVTGDYATQIQFTTDATNRVEFGAYGGRNYAYMTGNSTTPIYTIIMGQRYNPTTSECTLGVAVARQIPINSILKKLVSGEAILGYDNYQGTDSIYRQLFVNSTINYPNGYEGEQVPGLNLEEDVDEDGLSLGEEITQGAIDTQRNTDGDGLDDYVESQWNTDRDDIFCGVLQCAYPDPTTKGCLC